MPKDNKSYKVLIIEDNEGDRVLVEELLLETILLPVMVHAVNFKTAHEILQDPGSSFDVIFLDLSLPDKSGKALVDEILLIAPLIPVIVLTGYADMDFSIKSISQGVMDYLLKDEMSAATLYKSIIYSIERKKSFSAIKDSEQRYMDLFNLSPQPMWVFDVESLKFVQVNRATISLYEYSEAEFLGMSVMDIMLKEESDSSSASIKIKMGPPLYKDIVKHVTKSGKLLDIEIYSTALDIINRQCRSVIAIDVTEKNQHEHMIIKAIIKTQEDERYEIGGELHDNVCQILAVSQLNLGMLKSSLGEQGIPMYNECKQHINLALNEIRNLSHRLAPVFFDDISLEEALNRLIKSFNIDNHYQVSVYVDPAIKKCFISPEIQLNLYRIMQEQLRNIMKYAKGSEIGVEIVIYRNRLKMRITDNGVGFNPDEVKNGIGIANMRRRTELFSGLFDVKSAPGEGCVITMDIPIQARHSPVVEVQLN